MFAYKKLLHIFAPVKLTKKDFTQFLSERPAISLHSFGCEISISFAKYLNAEIRRLQDAEQLRPKMQAQLLPIMVKYGYKSVDQVNEAKKVSRKNGVSVI